MSDLTDLEARLLGVRKAIRKAEAMQLALCAADAPGFTVTVTVRGHFPSSSTYNQTESTTLNETIARRIAVRLADHLEDAVSALRLQEEILRREFAEAAITALRATA